MGHKLKIQPAVLGPRQLRKQETLKVMTLSQMESKGNPGPASTLTQEAREAISSQNCRRMEQLCHEALLVKST